MTARRSPYDVVRRSSPTQTATKAQLLEQVRELERRALEGPDIAFAIACLQDVRFLTEATTAVYAELARRGAQVLVLGRGVHTSVAPGVLGVDLDDDDPLGDEWSVLLAGGSFTCFVAQDLATPDVEDADRTFSWAQTEDPQVAAEVYDVLVGDLRARRSDLEVVPYPEPALETRPARGRTDA